jgi:hypothetical protein
MNTLKIQYKSKSYCGSLAFVTLWFFMMGCFVAIVFLVKAADLSPWIILIFAALIFGSPLIFKKKIKTLFTNKVLLEMDEKYFSISYLDSNGESIKKQKVYYWNTIQSYNFHIGESTPVLTTLTLHFKEGLPKSFNFIDKQYTDTKSYNQMFESECLFTIFYNQIKEYNTNIAVEDQIRLLPGFFASKTGKIIVYLLTTLIVAAIVLHLVIDPKSSYATLLISIGLVAGFFSKRKSSLELYKKIKEFDKKKPPILME